MTSRSAMRLFLAALVAGAFGLDWQDEVNVSMCNWAQLRANIIHDTLYLDGGDLWWEYGLSDGTYGVPQEDDGDDGLMYTFNLGQPFNQSTNLTGLFGTLSKTGGLADNNIAPDYIDGVMFANDGELITYGGLVRDTNSSSAPAADSILGYEAYEYGGSSIQSWSPGFIEKELPSGITRYITNGAGVSAPSENMGYYFSGMRAADWGPIYDGDGSADTLASTLISVNMTVMRGETWANDSLPDSVPARANAELVWVPVGENGVLVAVGGVIDPESLTVVQGLNASQANASMEVSPTFMETVSIYDISNQTWYQANTTGDIPPQLTLFCSVLAPASDNSSYNIYIYGGYNGINQTSIPSDDVYVLSVPQMVWTHAYNGTKAHGRSGHKCFRIYPDQMMVVGGIYAGDPTICLNGGIAEVFNLNTLEFQDSYDPTVWDEYSVPSVVTDNIGGNGNGSATAQAPSSLSSLFATPYAKSIATYYPYPLQTANATSTGSATSTPTSVAVNSGSGGSRLPTWVGPVLGVVLGLIVIAIAAIIFLLWRRRRARRRGGVAPSEAPTNASGIRGVVLRWLYGTSPPHDEKGTDGGVAAEERPAATPADLADIEGATAMSSRSHERHISEAGSARVHEMESPSPTGPIFEMDSNTSDFSPPWNDMQGPPRQASPTPASPNIDRVLSQGGTIAEAATTKRSSSQRYRRHLSNRSDRSDASNVSEIASSDIMRPPHHRQLSDNSVSDTTSLPASSQDGSASATTEMSSRDQTMTTAVSAMRDRIHTVHEVDELNTPEQELESNDGLRRQRHVTELE